MAATGSELVEHAWLDNFLDVQTTTIASSTRPTRTTNTTSVLHSVESQRHHHHHQQQPPQRVHSEHSYSLDNDNGVDFNVKIEPDDEHGLYTVSSCLYIQPLKYVSKL